MSGEARADGLEPCPACQLDVTKYKDSWSSVLPVSLFFFAQNRTTKLIIILPIPVPGKKKQANPSIYGSCFQEGMQWFIL